jgi:hypothetical protein
MAREDRRRFSVSVWPTIRLAAWIAFLPSPASAQGFAKGIPDTAILAAVAVVALSVGFGIWWVWSSLRTRANAYNLSPFGPHLWVSLFGLACLLVGYRLMRNGPENLTFGFHALAACLVGASGVVYYRTRDWLLTLVFPIVSLVYALCAGIFLLGAQGIQRGLGQAAEHDRVTRNERARQWVRRMN